MVVTQSMDGENPTGWKLVRIPLSSFNQFGTPSWSDVNTFRFRIESSDSSKQLLKIAKIELVENDWQEMGIVSSEFISDQNSFFEDPFSQCL